MRAGHRSSSGPARTFSASLPKERLGMGGPAPRRKLSGLDRARRALLGHARPARLDASRLPVRGGARGSDAAAAGGGRGGPPPRQAGRRGAPQGGGGWGGG